MKKLMVVIFCVLGLASSSFAQDDFKIKQTLGKEGVTLYWFRYFGDGWMSSMVGISH